MKIDLGMDEPIISVDKVKITVGEIRYKLYVDAGGFLTLCKINLSLAGETIEIRPVVSNKIKIK